MAIAMRMGTVVDPITFPYYGGCLKWLGSAFESATERLCNAPAGTDLVVVISCHGDPTTGNFQDWYVLPGVLVVRLSFH